MGGLLGRMVADGSLARPDVSEEDADYSRNI